MAGLYNHKKFAETLHSYHLHNFDLQYIVILFADLSLKDLKTSKVNEHMLLRVPIIIVLHVWSYRENNFLSKDLQISLFQILYKVARQWQWQRTVQRGPSG